MILDLSGASTARVGKAASDLKVFDRFRGVATYSAPFWQQVDLRQSDAAVLSTRVARQRERHCCIYRNGGYLIRSTRQRKIDP